MVASVGVGLGVGAQDGGFRYNMVVALACCLLAVGGRRSLNLTKLKSFVTSVRFLDE